MLPGFARGLAFHGDYALVGCSRPRNEGMFADLPIHDVLPRRQLQPQCGIFVVDLRSGAIAHWLVLEDDAAGEIFDLITLDHVIRPLATRPANARRCMSSAERAQVVNFQSGFRVWLPLLEHES